MEKCGALYGTPLKKRWKVPKTDMGAVERKRVNELYIFTEYPCSVTLIGDEGIKIVGFKGKGSLQRKRLTFVDRRVGLDIECYGAKACISRPTLTTVKSSF